MTSTDGFCLYEHRPLHTTYPTAPSVLTLLPDREQRGAVRATLAQAAPQIAVHDAATAAEVVMGLADERIGLVVLDSTVRDSFAPLVRQIRHTRPTASILALGTGNVIGRSTWPQQNLRELTLPQLLQALITWRETLRGDTADIDLKSDRVADP